MQNIIEIAVAAVHRCGRFGSATTRAARLGGGTTAKKELRWLFALLAMTPILHVGCGGRSVGQQTDKTRDTISTSREASAGSNAAQARMAAQAPLLTAAERIKKLDPEGTGLGGMELQVDKNTLNVWWKGGPPDGLSKEIASQDRANRIKVVLRSARYSQRELIEAARSIMVQATAYPGLVSVGPLVDGSGLEIGVTNADLAKSFRFPFHVQVVVSRGIFPLGRADDVPPFSAGAVTRAAVNPLGACSTGFAMTRGSTHGILTAQHCACGGNAIFNSGGALPIGLAESTSSHSTFSDSLFIPTISAAAIWDGGVGVGEFQKPVVGTQSNVKGMFVCTSGAASGVHCNIRIDKIMQASRIVDPTTRKDVCPIDLPFAEGLSEATQLDGTLASAAGDSGGPVFTLAADPSTVNAAGILTGGILGAEIPCQGVLNSCFTKVVFSGINSIRSVHNAEVMLALGASCSANSQCGSGRCDSGIGTSRTDLCMPNGNGQSGDICSNNNHCTSGICAGLVAAGPTTWTPGQCSATAQALGSACAFNNQCSSGRCDSGNGTSRTDLCMPNGNGQSGDICSNNNHCTSGICAGLHAQGNQWIPGQCQ